MLRQITRNQNKMWKMTAIRPKPTTLPKVMKNRPLPELPPMPVVIIEDEEDPYANHVYSHIRKQF